MIVDAALWAARRLPDAALSGAARALFSRSWKRFELAAQHPREAQLERLRILAHRARETWFGREHGFGEITDLASWQQRVPVRVWEDYDPLVARMLAGERGVLIPDDPFFYARSSGTTGTPKSIPVTPVYLAEYRTPRRVWARQVMQAFPGLVRGKILSVHSPKVDGRTATGVPFGSITVAMSGSPQLPHHQGSSVSLDPSPRALFLTEDFEAKYYFTLRLAAQTDVRLAAAVNPSTLVLLARKLDVYADQIADDLASPRGAWLERLDPAIAAVVGPRLRADRRTAERIRAARRDHGVVRPLDLWPELAGLICWKGGSAPFYLAQLAELFPGKRVMDYGFLATEGGFSIPLSPDGAHGVAAVTGHLLEFLPEDEADAARGHAVPALLAHELEPGRRYRTLVSGSHGLYRYDINDVVECVGRYRETAELTFVHKGGNMLSITGEKIGERHVVEAFSEAARVSGVPLAGFAVSVELTNPPRYVFAVEPQQPLDAAGRERVREAAEQGLRTANLEYAAKRDSLRLGPPSLVLLTRGAFERHRAARVAAGAPEAHVKPPHVIRELAKLRALGVDP